MNYSIGLDIGIGSVGYAVIMLDDNDEPCRIMKMGSRIFDAAEVSLNVPRRENRGIRRRLRRKKLRKERIRQLIENKGIMTSDEIDEIYFNAKGLTDIYQVRYESLDNLLSKIDFVRLLIHLSQRRGFKSNRKVDKEDKKSDAGVLLSAVDANQKLMKEKQYRTIGEMLYKDEKFAVYKRNKAASYLNTFSRKDYEDEIVMIFKCQRELGNQFADEEFEKEFLEIYLSQRSFDEGPGGNSIYGGNLIEKMIGKCTFEKDQLRAVKASFSFEYSNLLSKINSIKIVSSDGLKFLSNEEREKIKNLAFRKKTLTFASLRKELNLSNNEYFNISYGEKDFEETEKKTKFNYLSAYHTFVSKYGESFTLWSNEKKNDLAFALTVYKNDDKLVKYLREKNFDETDINIALKLPSFTKAGKLSVKVLDKMIPFLEKGLLYNEACEKAGYNYKDDEKALNKYLPANPEVAEELLTLNNPVVRRAVSQTIKVINAIIRKFDESPSFVHIELAREIAKSFDEREKIKKEQDKNRSNNEKIMDELRSNFGIIRPSGEDIVKYKLWTEQNETCPYSLQRIERSRLFEIGYTDIDHIIPYSLSFDDSYNNKVLVLSNENRQKGNRFPMQYLTGKQKDAFYVWVDNSKLRYRKKKNLLKETFTKDEQLDFRRRNLEDTQYISSFMLKYLKKYLELAPNNTNSKNTIVSVNGAATAYVRKRWGIHKVREDGDAHHAVDAVVIACITEGMKKRISDYSKHCETEYINPNTGEYFDINKRTGEKKNYFPMPYPYFRKELEMRCSDNPTRFLHNCPLPNYSTDEEVKPIFVSRMPKRKISGQAHEATIRKPYKMDDKDCAISKVPLTSLKLEKNEIKDYFNPSSDTLLYNALLERLKQFDGNAKKAFEQPFYKPKSDGTQGPLVKKVKTIKKSTLSVKLGEKSIADNGSMIRVDVFYVQGEGYYLVPIYVSDTVKSELPNKAITQRREYSDWKIMNDDDFLFSLYQNDLIKITSKRDMKFSLVNESSTLSETYSVKEEFVYYKGTDIATASIAVINHDNAYKIRGLGVKTLLSIEKYQVDALGNIYKSGKEKRMRFK